MPVYSYICNKCNHRFELFFTYSKYEECPQCISCEQKKCTSRLYIEDALTINASVKKSDSELRTIGDLANRNRDKLSDDEKLALYHKHNQYKQSDSTTELPTGMSRIKKGVKTKWTDQPTKNRRKINEKKRNS